MNTQVCHLLFELFQPFFQSWRSRTCGSRKHSARQLPHNHFLAESLQGCRRLFLKSTSEPPALRVVSTSFPSSGSSLQVPPSHPSLTVCKETSDFASQSYRLFSSFRLSTCFLSEQCSLQVVFVICIYFIVILKFRDQTHYVCLNI